jgi:AraC-like DNA-binding protein
MSGPSANLGKNMVQMNKLSANAAKIGDRLKQWQDFNSKAVGSRLRPFGCRSFEGELAYATIADVSWCKITASGHSIEGTEPSGTLDRIHVIFQLKGQNYRKQGDREVVTSAGEWTISDLGKPYLSSCSEDIELLVLGMPLDSISTKFCNISPFILRRLSGTSGVGKLAYEFGQDVFDQIGTLQARFNREVIEMLAHLIRLTLREIADEETPGSHKSMLCDRIKAYIARNLRDSELDIDRIAEEHNCTKRYLHKAFEGEEKSISEYIWELRLDSCRAELLNPAPSGKSITEIALSWGFDSSAHFSTAFRRRFGISPRDLRMNATRASRGIRGDH